MMLSEPEKQAGGNTLRRKATESGFTLIETSIAMVILMIAGLGVASLFTYAMQNNSGGNDRAVAVSLAQQKIEELRTAAFSDPILNVSAATTTSVTSNGRTYQVTKTVTGSNNNAGGNPTLKTITIQVTPRSPGWAGLPVILRTMRTDTPTGIY